MKKLKSLPAKVFAIFVLLLFLSLPNLLKAQNTSVTVSGKITDENGNGPGGATIQVKGTTTSTVAAVNGNDCVKKLPFQDSSFRIVQDESLKLTFYY